MKKQTKNMIWGILIVLLGMFFGYAAVLIGTLISGGGQWIPFLNGAKALVGNFTLAVFIGTLIAYYSKTPKIASIRAGLFGAGIAISYLINFIRTADGFPQATVMLRLLISGIVLLLLAAIIGYLIWHSKKSGWPAAFYAALPIGFLVSQGYRIYAGYTIQYVIALVLAVTLFILMPVQKGQRFKTVPMVVLVTLVIIWFDEIRKLMEW